MKPFQDYLAQFPRYTDEAFAAVEEYLSVIELEPGDYFLRAGQVNRTIAFINSGLVRLYYNTDEKEVTQCFCRERSLTCSYASLISNTPSEVSIQALELTQLVLLPYPQLQRLFEQYPFWQQVGRLAAEAEYLVSTQHHRFLTDLTATQRYEQVLSQDAELLQRVPLQHLASYLQVSPATLSRIRSRLART